MGEKKRKAGSEKSDRPSKKAQTDRVRVSHVASPDIAKPVIASSPGVTLSKELAFQSFSNQKSSNLLLHSSTHPTIDYTATESSVTDVGEKHMKHYIAVFDPASNKLQVTEAKRMTIRSSVRQVPSTADDGDEDDEQQRSQPSSQYTRAALTEAFGTKKSRKAVAAVAENRLLAQGGGDKADDPISRAILSSVDDIDDGLLIHSINSEDGTASRANKPLPQADLSATEISQVYPLRSLVFPHPATTTLSQMPTASWKNRVANKKEVSTRSRFVSSRVQDVVQRHLAEPESREHLQTMQLLRYILVLIEMHTYTTRLPSRRPVPPPEKWPERTMSNDTTLSTGFLAAVVRHFFPMSAGGLPTTHAKTLLTTTILALTLQIPPPKFRPGAEILVADPTEIALDLALQPKDVSKLYRELGCKMAPVSDAELRSWGWDKLADRIGKKVTGADGEEITIPRPKWPKLKFPIDFPKVSAGRPKQR
ncbi:hypothetical protein PV10_06117 [Exophiala mesophila]|uniref:DNA-directed RNA polymerase I subunit RPA49 n=1 Tax=Exophiala mesophila TaxID=212818 RepID=A0A0D1ZXP7_EXOME|nr:uncharacterized protein PV10_06117 [Exophiala mesophila]KIV91598.1 hypothetical protein PV10_06117 [Exophiala mesophila]